MTDAIRSQAATHILNNEFTEASKCYWEIINLNQAEFSDYYNFALSEFSQRNLENAFIGSSLALRLNPTNLTMLEVRAHCSWRFTNIEIAKKDFEQIRAIDLSLDIADFDHFLETEKVFNDYKSDLKLYGGKALDLSNIFFISSNHASINDINPEQQFVKRAIRIVADPDDEDLYNVSVWGLENPHPFWGNFIYVAPKRMNVFVRSKYTIQLNGIGEDDLGNSFENFSLMIGIDPNTGLMDSASLMDLQADKTVCYMA